tara:strand:- start:1961 stop:4393 length:2433 start_codon:yes stop_codon:yes gene_type:complete
MKTNKINEKTRFSPEVESILFSIRQAILKGNHNLYWSRHSPQKSEFEELVLFYLTAYKELKEINEQTSFDEINKRLKEKSKILNDVVKSITLSSVFFETPLDVSNLKECFTSLNYNDLVNNFQIIYRETSDFLKRLNRVHRGPFKSSDMTRLLETFTKQGENKKFLFHETGEQILFNAENITVHLKNRYDTLSLMKLNSFSNQKISLIEDEFSHPFTYLSPDDDFDVILSDHYLSKRHSLLSSGHIKELRVKLIDALLGKLTENGKLIFIVPRSFSNSIRFKKEREFLIENNLLKYVINLPGGLLDFSAIKLDLIIISKKNKEKKVGFFDLSQYLGIKNQPNSHFRDFEKIRRDYEKSFEYISNSEISEAEFILNLRRLNFKPIDGAISLSDVLKHIPTKPIENNEKYPCIKRQNLFESDSPYINIEDLLSDTEIQDPKFVDESCILIPISTIRNIQAKYFRFEGTPVILDRNIVAYRVNENMIDPLFLINEIQEKYVKEQTQAFSKGLHSERFNARDFTKLQLQIPSIEEQKNIVLRIEEIQQKLKALHLEKEQIRNQSINSISNDLSSLTHRLAKPLSKCFAKLSIIIKNLDNESLNTIIKNDKRLKDYLQLIEKDLNFSSELIKTYEKSIKPIVFEKLNFEFFEKYIENCKASEPSLNISLETEENYIFNGDKNLLIILFDELIENAIKHAFDEKFEENKILVEIGSIITDDIDSEMFDVSEDQDYIKIRVSNTGLPFDESITIQDYIRRHWSSNKENSGLGGYDVANAIRKHNNGKSPINLWRRSKEDDFSTTIEFLIPKINAEYV